MDEDSERLRSLLQCAKPEPSESIPPEINVIRSAMNVSPISKMENNNPKNDKKNEPESESDSEPEPPKKDPTEALRLINQSLMERGRIPQMNPGEGPKKGTRPAFNNFNNPNFNHFNNNNNNGNPPMDFDMD